MDNDKFEGDAERDVACVSSWKTMTIKNVMNAWMGLFLQATTGFQDSDIFQKAIKLVLRCILM